MRDRVHLVFWKWRGLMWVGMVGWDGFWDGLKELLEM